MRGFREGDFEGVVALWHETCRATYTFIPLEQEYDLDSRRGFFRSHILPRCALVVAEEDAGLLGFAALEGDYLDRLYVGLRLHTHVKNTGARAFYEKHGFESVRFGVSPAPESEPDVEYHWRP